MKKINVYLYNPTTKRETPAIPFKNKRDANQYIKRARAKEFGAVNVLTYSQFSTDIIFDNGNILKIRY